MSLNYPEGLFQNWEVAIAKKYVRQFRSTCQCLRRDVFEDLVDECLKHWFFMRDTVKPEDEDRRRAYMVQIVKNQLTDIVRSRRSEKRNEFFQAISLDQFLEDNPESPFLAHPFQQSQDKNIDSANLKEKIDNAIKKLSPQQKKVFFALQGGELTITQISVRLKVHRATIHNEINRIREVFENEGLRKYL